MINKQRAREDYLEQKCEDINSGDNPTDAVAFIMGHCVGQQYMSEELTKLQEELSQARKLIAGLVKMGEFYANPESWVRGKNDGNMGINSTDREYLNPCNYGGKRARTVLSNNKELIEKLTKE